MKVLTATSLTQGWRDNDFSWTIDGELVVFPPIECGCGTIDGGCGCHRAMAGLASHRATTTIQVTDRPDLDRDTYFGLVLDGLERQGYVPEELKTDPEVIQWLHDMVDDLVRTAAVFDSGTVLERRGGFLWVRQRLQADH